jgi:hypothetical protein
VRVDTAPLDDPGSLSLKTWNAAQGDEGRTAEFANLSGVNQSRGKCAGSLYRPVALLITADLGGSFGGIGGAITFCSASTQA